MRTGSVFDNRKILAVVPARGGSKGVPGKNKKLLAGIPLVGHAGNVVKKCSWIDRSMVSTDDPEIGKIAHAHGLDFPFSRPAELSGDRIGDLDVLNHALRAMEKKYGESFDVVLMLQPTSPFRNADLVRRAVERLCEGNFDSVWSVSAVDVKYHPLKQLVAQEDGSMTYFDERGASIIARQQLTPTLIRNGLVYAFTRECLLDQKSILGKRAGYIQVDFPYVNIDTHEDFEKAETMMNQAGQKL